LAAFLQILTTNLIREDIATEGAPTLEDHCRVCHRLGDMLECQNCSGVFHPACLDPPLLDNPDDDWLCYVCQADEVSDVASSIRS
jgi:nucleosome-remodeling factor subunit BPTF